MNLLKGFSKEDKIFLAGCIKSVIISDGKVGLEELNDLQKIVKENDFEDFDERLSDFETLVENTEQFWAIAGKITNAEIRDGVLSILQELSLQEGYQNLVNEHFLHELKEFWKIEN